MSIGKVSRPMQRGPKRGLRAVAMVALIVFLGAFGVIISGTWQTSAVAKASAPTPTSYPLTVTDNLGRTITIAAPPQRIISLAPSNTEILFALGLGQRIVGVDNYSNYPEAARNVTKVGGYSEPSLEKIVALEPDLVVGDNLHRKIIPQLERLGIPTLLLSPSSVSGVFANIKLLGTVAGVPERATTVVEDLTRRLEKVKKAVAGVPLEKRPWVYYEVYNDPIMTVGPKSFIYQAIELAGGRNIAYDASTDYPEFSPEVIIRRNPDIIVFPNYLGPNDTTASQFRSRPGWEKISAVQAGRIFGIDADIISRPGPRIVEAVETLARLFFSERLAK